MLILESSCRFPELQDLQRFHLLSAAQAAFCNCLDELATRWGKCAAVVRLVACWRPQRAQPCSHLASIVAGRCVDSIPHCRHSDLAKPRQACRPALGQDRGQPGHLAPGLLDLLAASFLMKKACTSTVYRWRRRQAARIQLRTKRVADSSSQAFPQLRAPEGHAKSAAVWLSCKPFLM